jgi:hypothetical protein
MSHCRLEHTPHRVVVSSGVLFPEWWEDAERASGSPVCSRYGSGEARDSVCLHTAFPVHVNPCAHIVKVSDADARRTVHGTGRIPVAVLNSMRMWPTSYHIRGYSTIADSESLYPMAGWQHLESPDERHERTLRDPDHSCFGPTLSGGAIPAIQDIAFINSCQIVQPYLEKCLIHLKLRPGHSPEEPVIGLSLDDLGRDLVRVLGPTTQIEFTFVDQVEALPSGKVPVCIVRSDEIANHARCHE